MGKPRVGYMAGAAIDVMRALEADNERLRAMLRTIHGQTADQWVRDRCAEVVDVESGEREI